MKVIITKWLNDGPILAEFNPAPKTNGYGDAFVRERTTWLRRSDYAITREEARKQLTDLFRKKESSLKRQLAELDGKYEDAINKLDAMEL